MENRLMKWFDFQKYEVNPALQNVIDSVHARYAVRELDVDDLLYVAAAGQPELPSRRGRPAEGKNEH